MDTKATFGFIEVPTSGSVAILERNSLRHWFVGDMKAAKKAIGDGLDIRVKSRKEAWPNGTRDGRCRCVWNPPLHATCGASIAS